MKIGGLVEARDLLLRLFLQKVLVEDLVAPPYLVILVAFFVAAYGFTHATLGKIRVQTTFLDVVTVTSVPTLVNDGAIRHGRGRRPSFAGSQAKKEADEREQA
tara:strand:+ start:6819 stop:7127 length:309 start_codon:yes stop_codon:yes gene_type:complete